MDERSLAQARAWANEITAQVLDLTWRAFEKLQVEHLQHIDLRQGLEQLERDLVSKHSIQINMLWKQEGDGFSSVCPHHEFPEQETRPGGKGKPPAYDLAFIYAENQRVAWPIEAKVLPSPHRVALYLNDVDKFVSGTAAPLIGEGGIIAYMLSGREADLFAEIQGHLRQILASPAAPILARRAHRISHHPRTTAPDLQLHHLAMPCGAPKAC